MPDRVFTIAEIAKMLREKELEHFWGELAIKLRDGKIVVVEVRTVLKASK